MLTFNSRRDSGVTLISSFVIVFLSTLYVRLRVHKWFYVCLKFLEGLFCRQFLHQIFLHFFIKLDLILLLCQMVLNTLSHFRHERPFKCRDLRILCFLLSVLQLLVSKEESYDLFLVVKFGFHSSSFLFFFFFEFHFQSPLFPYFSYLFSLFWILINNLFELF